jgi:hypothetical protein
MKNQHLLMTEISRKARKEAKSAKGSIEERNVGCWQGRTRGAIGSARHVER